MSGSSEFSSHPGVAYAAMLLAEQGATAIKVEPPAGAPGRGSPQFHVLNRSKRSVFIDIEDGSPAVREQVRGLIRWADIVIVGYTPRRAIALGLDYESVRSINPRVLLLSMPPLGSRGPHADDDACDDLVQARGGIAGSQWARSGNPVPLTFPAASYSAGAMGAIAAAAALVARGDGAGQSIEVSLLAGAFSLQTGSIMRHEKATALYARAADDPLGPIPCYRLYQAGDGAYLFVACGNATFWNKFALAIDRPDLVADSRFEAAPWGIPVEHWQTLKDILDADNALAAARRMAPYSARGRRSVRAGAGAPGIYRSRSGSSGRDAPGDRRPDPRTHRSARRAGHAARYARRYLGTGAGDRIDGTFRSGIDRTGGPRERASPALVIRQSDRETGVRSRACWCSTSRAISPDRTAR